MVGHTHPIGDFQLVRHCVQEVWECGDPAAATKYYDSTYLRCGPSDFEYVKGIEGVQSLIIAYHLAFRGLKLVVGESTHCGRWVCTRITVSGTHTGNFAGIAGSGKHVVFTMDCRDRVFEGKIINSRIYYDILELFNQIYLDEIVPANEQSGEEIKTTGGNVPESKIDVATLQKINVDKMHHQQSIVFQMRNWGFALVGTFLGFGVRPETVNNPTLFAGGCVVISIVLSILLFRAMDWHKYFYSFNQRNILCEKYLTHQINSAALVELYRASELDSHLLTYDAENRLFGQDLWGMPSRPTLLARNIFSKKIFLLRTDFVEFYLLILMGMILAWLLVGPRLLPAQLRMHCILLAQPTPTATAAAPGSSSADCPPPKARQG